MFVLTNVKLKIENAYVDLHSIKHKRVNAAINHHGIKTTYDRLNKDFDILNVTNSVGFI